MKRTKVNCLSKTSSAKLQRKLWLLCKTLVRRDGANPTGSWNCYCCNRLITDGRDAHTAHLIPKGSCGAFLKYDLRNLRVCCYNCNINLGGNGAVFVRNMIVREGQEYVDKIFEDKLKILSGKQSYEHYSMLLEKYSIMLEDTNFTLETVSSYESLPDKL